MSDEANTATMLHQSNDIQEKNTGKETSSPHSITIDSPTLISAISENNLKNLNDSQRLAVLHSSGAARVIAGAGTGKTGVLTNRIAYLIDNQIAHPQSILAITFTNKAANEMKKRMKRLVPGVSEDMWVCTFHRACLEILRENSERAGYREGFTISDNVDSRRLISHIIKDLGLETDVYKAKEIQREISIWKNQLLTVELITKEAEYEEMKGKARIYTEYQERLILANAVDFDDMLMQTERLFREHPDVLEHYQNKFSHILVDEFQDSNTSQGKIVLQLGSIHNNVFVVGDNDQSIYAFRGADSRNMEEFHEMFDKCQTYLLEQNYRSTKPILDIANSLIANNSNRVAKNLWTNKPEPTEFTIAYYEARDDREEAYFVAKQVETLCFGDGSGGLEEETELSPSDIAVFYRTNVQSRVIEEAFVRQNIAYKIIGGTRFYDRYEVRDGLAFLRCAVNPDDEVSMKRILNKPARGIGATSIQKLDTLRKENGISFSAALRLADSVGMGAKAASGVAKFVRIHDELQALIPEGPKKVLLYALKESGYMKSLVDEDTFQSLNKHDNMQELIISASRYKACDKFLEYVALVSDTDDLSDEDKVLLMTLHASKGLEFPVVFFTGLEEGLCPHVRSMYSLEAIEEERRLAYVGITRAKSLLYLTHALCRQINGQIQNNSVSDFFHEAVRDISSHKIDDYTEKFDATGIDELVSDFLYSE